MPRRTGLMLINKYLPSVLTIKDDLKAKEVSK